ncbi:MAG: hypothetical protein ACM3JH_06540 [Acidithiobacillales bacterium]
MRFRGLAELRRPEGFEATLAALPETIRMTRYAYRKAYRISDVVRAIHGDSYEWYGFTIAGRRDPELVQDIGLPENDQNLLDHARVGSEAIAAYQESLPEHQVINGWIHSHGTLPYEKFSPVDDGNQEAVLDYVTAPLRRPVAKKEILIKDLAILVKDRWSEKELERGSVALITDAPITEARIIETIYGEFCYAIVIGDSGWHRQQIHYRRRGILSGRTTTASCEADIVLSGAERPMTDAEILSLEEVVRSRIRPGVAAPRERFEKEAT